MKKSFKISAAFLAVCVMLSTNMAVFAKDITAPGSGETEITATTSLPLDPAYTVTIPATIPVGNLVRTESTSVKSTAFTVSAANVAALGGKKVDISISTADGSFNLSDGNLHKLPYQVFNTASGGTALASGDLFIRFTADESATGRVDIDQANIRAAGSYSGTLTFTIALNDAGGSSIDGWGGNIW